ncbi:MAG: hypothetical protein Q4G70_03650 [Pseudomonadota bacterium]|nr:hypothetical protein [Pseudomonadota bacterium]
MKRWFDSLNQAIAVWRGIVHQKRELRSLETSARDAFLIVEKIQHVPLSCNPRDEGVAAVHGGRA